MKQLDRQAPETYAGLVKGNFVTKESTRRLSQVPGYHVVEHCNK